MNEKSLPRILGLVGPIIGDLSLRELRQNPANSQKMIGLPSKILQSPKESRPRTIGAKNAAIDRLQ